ncbi:MAG: peptidoglycan DD-metalloendopeptidase family protein [Pseudomonadota bacterium]
MRIALQCALLALALLQGCGGAPRRLPPVAAANVYVVRAGDTLYSISWRNGVDYHDVARWNGIGADFRIDVGQQLLLQSPSGAVAGAVPRPAPRPVEVPLPVSAPPHWQWPADGVATLTVGPPSGAPGLRIVGATGAPVRAAAAGRVVYRGSGLRAYGQLVIIKHDDTWLSAYGYNSELYVAEGETVREGQKIAAMGIGPGNQSLLYFEIRQNGRPVDPQRQLPPR